MDVYRPFPWKVQAKHTKKTGQNKNRKKIKAIVGGNTCKITFHEFRGRKVPEKKQK